MFRSSLVVALAGAACVTAPTPVSPSPPVEADAGVVTEKVSPMPQVPSTRVQLISDVLGGLTLKDPYRWLEDEQSPEVQEWMKAQDLFARERLTAQPGHAALLERFRALYYVDSLGAPLKRGGRYFYSRTHKDKEKAVVYWRANATAPEQVLLDPNAWSTDNTVSLGVWVPSWDGRKVVFAQKPNAADEATLYVLDVDTGARSPVDVLPGARYASPSWLPDSKSFLYAFLPDDPKVTVADRPGTCELRRHVLGEAPVKDQLVYPHTGDPKTFLGASVSRDGHWWFATVMRGWNENDLYFKRAGKDAEWRLLIAGKDAKYEVDAWKDQLYVFTDEGAPNKRVFRVDPAHPERKAWRELIAEDRAASRETLVIVGGHLAISSLKKAVSVVELFTLEGKRVREVELPGLGTASNLYGNEDDDEAFFSFSSFVSPPEVFRTSVKTGKSERWSKVELPVDAAGYEVRQVSYPSKDGTSVTMFIVAAKGVKLDGANPTLLYGYGGFDVSMRSAWTSFIYPWLEAGGVYAVPNLRGGGEYGKAWHDGGKQAHKQNVFDDFEAAAEYLVREKWTQPRRLAIRGGSNGGLLVGAAMTQRPDLFGAVICAVPLLDMVRYHLYGSGKTWVPEYGDPEKPDELKVLAAYSPYHHVTDGTAYPPLLMMSADHDDRVDPFHARKFVAAVQGATGAQTPVWLRIERNAGHGGADQVGKAIESSADQLAFLFGMLSVQPK